MGGGAALLCVDRLLASARPPLGDARGSDARRQRGPASQPGPTAAALPRQGTIDVADAVKRAGAQTSSPSLRPRLARQAC